MKEINADTSYKLAEQYAAQYFKTLYDQAKNKQYVSPLIKDIHSWKHSHTRFSLSSIVSRFKKESTRQGYYPYIRTLDRTGKLDDYLERSISYIFIRDMGAKLNESDTQEKIQQVVEDLKTKLLDPKHNGDSDTHMFTKASLYRLAKQHGVESTMIWLIDKLKLVSSNIPEEMDVDKAQFKLIKVIAGVVMNTLDRIDDEVTSKEERAQSLDKAIRLGYAYGLTYPFIDDLFDSKILSANEEKQYADLIRTTLTTGEVPALVKWNGKNKAFIHFVHAELKRAFEYIRDNQPVDSRTTFLEQAYVFFQSQEVDRLKNLSNPAYTNEDLYIPAILKSASSRLIVHSITSGTEAGTFENHPFFYGIYNQLSDDLTDMFSDLEQGAVTPYTYYLKYHHQRPDLLNPFELYWTVIYHLIHHIYDSDPDACEVILNRAINGLKRLKKRFGSKKYTEVMALFTAEIPAFNSLIQRIVRKVDDVDFFDKLLRDHVLADLRKERKQKQEFTDTVQSMQHQINDSLLILNDIQSYAEDPIIEAANYSLTSDAKRLRPIVTWVIGSQGYGLESTAIEPLVKSLEYMHTASLIFDDLPSQDNASIRRGQPTLHEVYDTSIAELTGLYLTQKPIEELTTLDAFDPRTVLRVIRYSTQSTEAMCKGQVMDLHAKGKQLTIDELRTICFYKTGLGFEASLVMPAILAHATEEEISRLKMFARHLGMVFQIKDDLLDVEGDLRLLGKRTGKDVENKTTTFVSLLGVDGAKKEMWDHYCLAFDALQAMPRHRSFLKYVLNYCVHREQ
ncbi:polyprenyl synthetase family protein [Aquibacillus sediminis]|uniref:polyprenyl synthetase family protein n=1 Tax=Aquibacillus sediminis TaxID=2574734 RepID=UPI001109F602|nr:polyprenyl synthetase family protein [Aquibacillus sediminis]